MSRIFCRFRPSINLGPRSATVCIALSSGMYIKTQLKKTLEPFLTNPTQSHKG